MAWYQRCANGSFEKIFQSWGNFYQSLAKLGTVIKTDCLASLLICPFMHWIIWTGGLNARLLIRSIRVIYRIASESRFPLLKLRLLERRNISHDQRLHRAWL